MSIIKALKKIEEEKLTSFHVPGHKNGRMLGGLPFGNAIASYDTTEIPGTDNLHAPENEIMEAEQSVADFYKAIESHFLINGTTAGIISMIYGAFKPGDKVLISRDAHKSVFTGMILARLVPVYIMPEVDKDLGLSLGITKETVKKAYEDHSDLAGLIITYPNYHGICTDLEAIENIVHSKGGLLLVDGAHGAHLNLSDALPLTAIECGADVVVHSTHKSLPAFTQSSLLHICSRRLSSSKIKMALGMFQSSSPSYLLMASIENAIRVAKNDGTGLMKNLLDAIDVFDEKVSQGTCFEILKANRLPASMALDGTKITLLLNKTPISGRQLELDLREKYGIQCEYSTDSMVLFITSIATSSEDLNRLYEALHQISQEIVYEESRFTQNYDFQKFDLEMGLLPWEAVQGDMQLMALKNAIGECAGEYIVPYPPGIPIVLPGEVISEQVVNFIEEGCRKGYNVNGVYNQNTLQVNIIKKVTK
jgi:arginine/lysine/ornithine decarboxylase